MADIETFINQYQFVDDPNLDTIINDLLNAPICLEEVSYSLKCIKTGKATGIDGIPSECHKYASAELLQPVTALFNYVFESGIYPDKWCEGIINPIHKQGSRLVAESYRKITVSPGIGKLFDTIINNRLVYYRRISNEEDPFQNGFKEKSRTTDNAFILNGIVEKYKANLYIYVMLTLSLHSIISIEMPYFLNY